MAFSIGKTQTCFFCHSAVQNVKIPSNFRCYTCGCWNRRDAKGEIINSDPAMHDEAMNTRSFARRGSPSKNQLPTMYKRATTTPFCRNCQNNQMLIMNLMASYLPDPSNSEYEQRLKLLPEYEESLHSRYPLVCEQCAPAVDDEIQRKDSMARQKALGGWLESSKGKDRERQVSTSVKDREQMQKEMMFWRIRGALWAATAALFIFLNSRVTLGLSQLVSLQSTPAPLMAFLVVSLLWSFWDPTYSAFRHAKLQGREVRVEGKRTYLTLQWITWGSRMLASVLFTQKPLLRWYSTVCLGIELLALLCSIFVLRLQKPPTIRLIQPDKTPLSRSTTPNPPSFTTGSQALSSLSLSSKPVVGPVFGLSSLGPTPTPKAPADAMDWSPTEGSGTANAETSQWFRPQVFFAPEQATGLESLLQRTKLVEDVTMTDLSGSTSTIRTIHWRKILPWLGILPVLVLGYSLGRIGRRPPSPASTTLIGPMLSSVTEES